MVSFEPSEQEVVHYDILEAAEICFSKDLGAEETQLDCSAVEGNSACLTAVEEI